MMLRNKFLLISLSGLVLLFAFFAIGQTQVQGSNVAYDTLPSQVEGDVLGNQVKLFNINELASTQPGVDVNVSTLAGNEAEVSIDVNPTNPNNQVIVGHAAGGFATMNTFFTTDGGQNWTLVALGNAQDGLTSTFRFDPTVAFDNNGNVYVGYGVRTVDASGNNQETVVVARSTNGGQSYTQFAQVSTNLHPTLPGNDKWHLATGPDPFIPAQQNVYIAWTQNVNEPGTDQRIVVSVSTNGGATFSAPPLIINDPSIAGTSAGNLFADPAVGPNGELYVAWEDINNGQVFVDVSLDGGVTFGTDILVTTSGTGFKTSIPAQVDRGVFVGPTIDVDRSILFNGRLYITYTDLGTGGLPDTDIFVRSSANNGTTWSAPTLVNDDGGTNSQFLPWLDVDQQTGAVAVVWYDARNDTNNQLVDIFMAVSDNGGVSFLPNILVSDGQSDQSTNNANRSTNNYLEYIGITISGCEAFPVWSDNSTNPADLDFFTDQVQITGLDTLICERPPDCDAGGPYTGECSVTLDGTNSSDPEGGALTYSWTTDCPGGSFDDANSATPVLTVSSPCNINCNVTLTVTDSGGLTSQCTATVSIDDTTSPGISCNSPGTIIPPDAPISFTATATDNCDPNPTVVIDVDFECFKFTKKGKRIDKTESCDVQVDGDTITILNSGGVGDRIEWTVQATDACGNQETLTCGVNVVNPAK